ncbi:hypothetical protein SCUCBS95973_003376 [Sporothrix curviconia]|uniref:ADP-ribosylhydrolase ARH3 n=1 Tax=Sporothrix curviconia TaxID=1260050 RepID=A0ABP0BEV5_9PEZI
MATKKQRILGALLGVHAGDSFGAAHEFETWQAIRQRFPPDGAIPREITGGGPFGWAPGHATDDTDMTRSILLGYMDAKDAKDAKDASGASTDSLGLARAASKHMLQWFNGPWADRPAISRPSDVGGATARGLMLLMRSAASSGELDPRRAGAGHGSCGNGSLMRCIPTALFATDSTALIAETALLSAVTHNDWRCILACVAYNAMVRALVVDGAAPADAITAGLDTVTSPATTDIAVAALTVDGQPPPNTATLAQCQAEVVAAIDRARLPSFRVARLADEGPHILVEDDNGQDVDALPLEGRGFVLDSLILAVAAVLDTTRSWEELVVDVVRVGRDTDTNGAVAGGLVGARDGIEAIPATWRAKLQFGDEFAQIVDQLVGA